MNVFTVGRRPFDAIWPTFRLKDITSYLNRGVSPAYSDEETDSWPLARSVSLPIVQ